MWIWSLIIKRTGAPVDVPSFGVYTGVYASRCMLFSFVEVEMCGGVTFDYFFSCVFRSCYLYFVRIL
jgi:hypothetical protein